MPFTTLADALRTAAEKTPARTLLVDGAIRLDCATAYQQARALACALLGRMQPGSVVSFMLPNWHEAAVVYLGATLAGMIVNPILPSLRDRELTFIDIGAGKGRVLLLASRLPVRRMIGVEYSPELCAVAERNVAAWGPGHPDAAPIELVCQDATTYAFPDEPLLVYMYNPFEEPLMLQVLANLRASIERCPRRVLLVLMSRSISEEALAAAGFAMAAPPELFLPAPLPQPA